MSTSLPSHPLRHPPGRDRGTGRMFDLGRLLIGLVVVAVGTVYLLEGAGVLDAGATIAEWWPAVVIALGLAQIVERARVSFGPLLLVGAGTVLLLATTDVIEGGVWSYVWPAALIAIGIVTIRRWAGTGAQREVLDDDDVVVASGVFGGPTAVSASQRFRAASLTAVFGGVTLDLRQARPAADGARITATALFGGIDVLVPRGWRLSVRGTPIFGGVEDKTEHAALADDAPTLIVDALAIFGGVEIAHEP